MEYRILKNLVESVIKPNGNNEITGQIMQDVIMAVINAFGTGYQFIGVADDETEPTLSDGKQLYLCGEGDYTNFGEDFKVEKGEIGFLTFDTEWHLNVVAIDLGRKIETADLEDESVTTSKLSETLQGVLSALVAGYTYQGIADSSTNPSNITIPSFYLTKTSGTYTHFLDSGSQAIVVPKGINILMFDSNYWSLNTLTRNSDFINVNDVNSQATAYANAAAARAAVPVELRKLGLQITYLLENGWFTDQFIGDDVTDWSVADNWKTVGPVSVSQNSQTGHTDITIGSTTTPVASVGDVGQLAQEMLDTTRVLNGNITGEYVIDEDSLLQPGYVTGLGIQQSDSYHYCVIENNEKYSAIIFDTNTHANVSYIVFEKSNGFFYEPSARDSARIIIPANVIKIYFNFFGGTYANKFSIISSYSIQEQFESTFNIAKYINRGYINTNGEYVSAEANDWYTTDFFEVVANQKIKVFGIADNHSMLCFYDKDKNPILPLVYITNPGFNLVDVPDIAHYCRSSLFVNLGINNNTGVIVPIVSKNNEQTDDSVVNYTKNSPGVQNGYVSNQIYSSDVHHYLYVEFNNDRTPDYIEFSGSIVPGVAYVQLKRGNSIIAYVKTKVESGRFSIPPCDGVYLNFFGGADGFAELFAIHYSTQSIQLFESIDKPFNFNGKHLVAYGDSITWGVYSPGLGRTETSSYIAQFCLKNNTILNNRGWSGATLTYKDGSSLGCISQRIMGESFADADIIWVAAGTNDYYDQRPLGAFGDSDNTTMYGAMKVVCDYLSQTYPGKPVIFMTPIPFTKASSSYGKPISLDKYRKAIEEVACANGYSVINGASLGIIESAGGYGNAMIDDTDGCHPTLEGHKLMARSLCGKLL